MEVRAAGVARVADAADDLARGDILAAADVDLAQVAIKGGEGAVGEDDGVAVTIVVPAGEDDAAAVGGEDRGAGVGGEIDAGMDQGIAAHPRIGTQGHRAHPGSSTAGVDDLTAAAGATIVGDGGAGDVIAAAARAMLDGDRRLPEDGFADAAGDDEAHVGGQRGRRAGAGGETVEGRFEDGARFDFVAFSNIGDGLPAAHDVIDTIDRQDSDFFAGVNDLDVTDVVGPGEGFHLQAIASGDAIQRLAFLNEVLDDGIARALGNDGIGQVRVVRERGGGVRVGGAAHQRSSEQGQARFLAEDGP